jgi:exo-beta-1,3-glucanase (GH17 family)
MWPLWFETPVLAMNNPMRPKFECSALTAAFAVAALAIWGLFWMLGQPIEIPEPLPVGQKLQCVSYTPFVRGESPLEAPEGLAVPAARIRADLRLLSRWSRCVRTYSARALGPLPSVARELGMEVLLGAWVNSDPELTRDEIESAVALAARYPSVIKAVIVGNEVLLRGEMTGQELARLILEVKGRIVQPVTYADVWAFWLKHPEVAPAVDFLTIHILPYWEDLPVPVGQALAHVMQVRDAVAERYPGRKLLIGEAGWPSEGRMRLGALPSLENEARFIRAFVALAEREHWRYNVIEAFDQPWKRLNEGAVGGAWGLFTAEREDKHVLSGSVSNWPHWRSLAVLGCLLLLALFAAAVRGRPRASRAWLAALAAAVGAVSLVIQIDQFRGASRSPSEYRWAAVVLALAFGALWNAVAMISAWRVPHRMPFRDLSWERLRRRTPGAVWSALQAAVGFCASVASVALAFDPRYRSFPGAGLLAPAAAFAVVATLQRRAQVGGGDYREEAVLGVMLAAAACAILAQETPLNRQADLWGLACGLLAWSLLLPHLGRRESMGT